MRLEGKVAIVTGAGQRPGEGVGNGRATALLFAREGAKVLLGAPEVRVLCSTGITWRQHSYDPVRLPPGPPSENDVEAATLTPNVSPPITCITFPTCWVEPSSTGDSRLRGARP